MKKITLFIFVISHISFVSAQVKTSRQSEKIVFFDKCIDKKVNIDYKLDTISNYVYKLTYSVTRGDWTTGEVTILSAGSIINSVEIDKILLFENNTNPTEKTYLNCEKICQGRETEYYPNGVLKKEGAFKNGIPEWIKFYYNNGKIQYHTTYENNTFHEKRTNHYDFKGQLNYYYIYERKANKLITKKFDKNGKLTFEEVEDIEQKK